MFLSERITALSRMESKSCLLQVILVLYSFGIELPKFDEAGWTAQIPEGIFEDSGLPKYKDISHLTGAAPRISKIAHTSELI